MPRGARTALFLALAAGLAVLYGWGVLGLPAVGNYRGPYGDLVNAATVRDRHITDAVSAVNFDIRGFDTLGEEFILFAAVMGVALLLRKHPGESERPAADNAGERRIPRTSDAVRLLAVALVGPVALFGLYVVSHGQVSPGGGFQGGAILATAPLLIYLAGEFEMLRRIAPHQLLEIGEAVGAGGYVLIGLLGTLAGDHFLSNVLPLGRPGDVFSGGTVALINLAVGLEVAAGFLLLLLLYLEETLSQKEEV